MIQVTRGRLVECNGVRVVTVNWLLQSAHSCSPGREVRPSARNRQTWNEPQNGQKGPLGQISVSRKPRAVSGSQKPAATSRTLGMSHKASSGLRFIVIPPSVAPDGRVAGAYAGCGLSSIYMLMLATRDESPWKSIKSAKPLILIILIKLPVNWR